MKRLLHLTLAALFVTAGSVEMIQEGGAWKVGRQSWSDKPE